MNLTELNRRIVRSTNIAINGVPLIVGLEPGGQISLKLKGTRRTAFIPLMTLYNMVKDQIAAPESVVETPKPKEAKRSPGKQMLGNALVALLQEAKQPVHNQTLKALMRGELEGKALQALYDTLQKEKKIRYVKPFSYEAIPAGNH